MPDNYTYLDIETLYSIRTIYQRHLNVLTKQAASFGPLYVPVHIAHQLEDMKAEIDAINRELAQRSPQTDELPH